MSITGYGIECRSDARFFNGKPEIVKLTIAEQAEEVREVTKKCITYMSSGRPYLSPKGLYNKSLFGKLSGYGFKYDGEKMLPEVVEISQHDRQQPRKFFQKGRAEHDKLFTLCRYKYQLDPDSAQAMIARTHNHTPYVYALVPKEWQSSESDFFGGGRKKKRKSAKRRSTKRKSTKRRSTKKKSKKRKYKKTRRRRH